MAEIPAKVVEIGLPYLVDCAKSEYRYLFRFGSFRDKLTTEVERLEGAQEDVSSRVKADKDDSRIIKENVRKWLENVSEVLRDANTLMVEMENKKGCFMGRTCWYGLSKKFKKTTLKVTELREDGDNYDIVSLPRAPLSIPYVSSSDFMLSKSSETALDKIVKALKNESTRTIGLYGMGGVGKTTLAKQVIKLVENSKQFDKVVMVVVSQTPDLMAIQDKVAAVLGLHFVDEIDVSMKADRLRLRLEEEKNILIILDDIWEKIDLSNIGITFTADQKDCKKLITTRNHKMCYQMECEMEIHIDVLCQTEAWDLFKERADLDDESPMIDIAAEVAKECGGLPIAIVPLARALAKNTLPQWKVALQCLQTSNLPGIENIDINAYKCLKVSYDKLNGAAIKSCFLMCSLFPEDYEVEIEILIKYAWGLGVCRDAETIENARVIVQASIDHLKEYCLLIHIDRNKVKMHDVVRDFALWMAFNEEKSFTVGCISRNAIISKSLETYMAVALRINETQKLPRGLVCEKLRLLLLYGDYAASIPNIFFEQLKDLEVLDITQCSLPPCLPVLSINLRTLCLEKCRMGDISSLGKLKKLEILSLSGSDIRELPDKIGEIKGLKVLDLSSCVCLQRIPAGLIQKLACLEELYVIYSNSLWDTAWPNRGSTSKACISELNSLSKLKVLYLDQFSLCRVPHDFVMPNVTEYVIIEVYSHMDTDKYSFPNTLEISGDDISLDAYKRLFATVEHLTMYYNDGIRCIVPDIGVVFNNLISLDLEYWKGMICLIDTTVKKEMAFQKLKTLKLLGMDSLEELCRGEIPNEFLQKLEIVSLKECPKLCSVFPVPLNFMLATQQINLNRLREVSITDCSKLKSIFSLSMARTLVHLESLYINGCDELEQIIEEKEEESSTSISHLIFTQLVKVSIKRCNKLKYIFPIPVAPSCLQQLKELSLEDNIALEQIFKYAEGNQMEIKWPHLTKLKIKGSSKLVSFSRECCPALSFPSLQHLEITDCCAIQFPPFLEAKRLFQVILTKVPKELWNSILSQLNLGNLPNLGVLLVQSLIGFEELIRLEVDDQRSDFILPMHNLDLIDLPQLSRILNCPSHNSILQNLRYLTIKSCHKMRYIFSPTLAQNLPMLHLLRVHDCKELVQVIGNGNDNEGAINHLRLEDFFNLQTIIIRNCNKITFVFPISLVGGLPNLQELSVIECDALEYVFGNKTSEAGKNIVEKEEVEVVLPQMNELVLKKLPSLRGFSVGGCSFIFPLLDSEYNLKVDRCPNISETFTLSPTDGTTVRKNASLAETEYGSTESSSRAI